MPGGGAQPGKGYIGTSGWSYNDWAKGRFYPKGLKQGEWLRYFAERFGTVEVNASFYRLPRPEMITRWHSLTGSRFRFAVKLWRRITHLKRLADCRRELGDFFGVVAALGRKRGPLLVQLPPSLTKDVARLDTFLTDLKQTAKPARWKVTVEFRHPSWLCDEVYRLLDSHRVALCLADLPRCPITEPNDASFVYLRRHGPGGDYRGCYAPAQVAADASRVRRWLQDGRDVFVYYNNDIGGHAIDNARQLIDQVSP